MPKTNPFITVPVIVENLRSLAKDIATSKMESFTIPMHGSLNEKYPMGIQPGNYSRKELAEAMQFLADMLEE